MSGRSVPCAAKGHCLGYGDPGNGPFGCRVARWNWWKWGHALLLQLMRTNPFGCVLSSFLRRILLSDAGIRGFDEGRGYAAILRLRVVLCRRRRVKFDKVTWETTSQFIEARDGPPLRQLPGDGIRWKQNGGPSLQPPTIEISCGGAPLDLSASNGKAPSHSGERCSCLSEPVEHVKASSKKARQQEDSDTTIRIGRDACGLAHRLTRLWA